MLGFGTRWKIGSIGRIPIYVGPTWLLVVFFVATSRYSLFNQIEPAGAVLLTALFTVGFFGAVFMHELAHAWMSRRLRIPVRGITMMFFGGATETRANARGPGAEFLVSAAGPASTLILSAGFWLAASTLHGVAHGVVSELAALNLLFAIFNTLPAVPLDGGRMLTAIIWRITGNRRTGQRAAGYVGTAVGIGMGVLAYRELTDGGEFGFFLVLIAFLLVSTGRSTEARVLAQEQLAKGTAADAMRDPPASVPAGSTLQEALDRHLRDAPQESFPVVDQGRVVGTVSVSSARKVGRRDPTRPVRDGMASLDLTPVFSPDETLDMVAEWLNGMDGLVLRDGALVGAIGPTDITQWYQRTLLPNADATTGAPSGGIPPRPDL
jgi:Zn-dependent protease/predicted transcriptional regulator